MKKPISSKVQTWITITVAALLSFGIGMWVNSEIQNPHPKSKTTNTDNKASLLPDGTDSNGKPIRLNDYHGKWIIVNYWATWCNPCLTEMPTLDSIYRSHPNEVMVLGVSFDELTHAEIIKFSEKLHISYPLLTEFSMKKLGVENIPILPMTFIFDPQGKLVKQLTGSRTKEQFLKEIHLI